MSTVDTIMKTETPPVFHRHGPIVFDPQMMRDLNIVFHEGRTLKYLSDIRELDIPDSVINHFGVSLSVSIKGVTPRIQRIELLTSFADLDFRTTHGELAVFTPAQFWNNVTKVIERERKLLDQSDSVLGEDTLGLVFLVEKSVKDVPTLFAVNLYREIWRYGAEYCIRVFKTGGMWEPGHSFAIKLPK